MASVSYTHLDVYKRQKEDLPVWAADIAKGASKQSNDTKPAVSGQAGVSF